MPIPGQVFSSAEAAARTDSLVRDCLTGSMRFRIFFPQRSLDLMQLVAEIASYEDFVDEGNYNVVATLDEVVLHNKPLRKRPWIFADCASSALLSRGVVG